MVWQWLVTARAVMAAAIAGVALLLSGATPGVAAPYTINFTGTVNGTSGAFLASGVAPGDAVSGSLTFDDLATTPSFQETSPDSVSIFAQAAGSFTFHVSHPGAFDYTQTRSGAGQVDSSGATFGDGLNMLIFDSVAELQLNYFTDATNPALTSLAGLPSDPGGILALLTGQTLKAAGLYTFPGVGTVSFNLNVAATPIPPALPLFVSALGGFGLLAWRRRLAAN